MSSNQRNDYLSNYQYNHFQETVKDAFKTVDIKRKCLIQTFNSSLPNESLANTVIEEKLDEYFNVVDDQSKINNYAASIEDITSDIDKRNCSEWKCELKVEDFTDMISNLNCCSEQITQQEVSSLFYKKQPLPENKPSWISKPTNIPKNPPQNFKYQKNQNQRAPCKPVEDNIQAGKRNNCGFFKTAREELDTQMTKKYGNKSNQQQQQQQQPLFNYGAQKKSLGARRGIQSKFVPPIRTEDGGTSSLSKQNSPNWDEEVVDERLKNIDPRMVELIRSEIMDSSSSVSWDDIAGLEFAKTIIKEVVVWPLLRPDIFTGLRRPPKGILLFGPPGTGKTLIGKCIASQSQSTFFSISASSLTSKWIGDGEKMVRAMFAVARCHQPAVVFIDEVDSLLSQRSDTEHESSRRIKTEFLVQLDGASTADDDRILVIGATNRPQELDEAARRRFVKRLYIPLPEKSSRLEIVKRLMSSERNDLSEENINQIAELSKGYSGADMKCLCAEASLGPIRSIDISMIQNIQAEQVRAITMADFHSALSRVRASVSSSDLDQYVAWDKTYGAGGW